MILKKSFQVDSSYAFPKPILDECQKSCKFEYLYSSFVYSLSDHSVHCIDNCAMFLSFYLCFYLLHEHVHSPLWKGVSYMTPTSQNELMNWLVLSHCHKWLFLQTKLLVYMCICVCVYIYIYIVVNTMCINHSATLIWLPQENFNQNKRGDWRRL